jgi:hypothetical protein
MLTVAMIEIGLFSASLSRYPYEICPYLHAFHAAYAWSLGYKVAFIPSGVGKLWKELTGEVALHA